MELTQKNHTTAQPENELGVAPVKKLLFKLALPAIIAQVVNVLYNIVDRMYIGHIPVTGTYSLTGLGICMPLILMATAFAALTGMGGAPRASVMIGQGKKEEGERILGNSFALMLILSVILTFILFQYSEQMLWIFGASENTIGYAVDYIRIYALGTVFVQISLSMNSFISAQGFAKTSMYSILIGAIANIILDPIFIYALGMGVKGAALATIISQMLSAIWVLSFLTGKKTFLRLQLKNMSISPKVILPCVLLGLSPFVMQFTESIIGICFNASLLKYGGDTAVGAVTILLSVMQFCMLPLIGLAQGAQPITGYNYGAGNADRVRESFRILLIASVTYSMLLWVVVMLFPRQISYIFNSDPQLLEYSAWAMRRFMFVTGVFGVQIACQQTFIAIGNAATSLFLAVFRKILLLIPLIYILPMFMENKAEAVFLAEPVADAIAVTTTAILFAVQFKQAMKKLEERNMTA